MNPINNQRSEEKHRESLKQESEHLTLLLETIFDFKHWGFHQSYVRPDTSFLPRFIYDSEWCRVSFSLSGGDQYPGHDRELSISYGRLHAADEEPVVIWDGEMRRCWHNVFDALFFLEGFSPQEAVDPSQSNRKNLNIVELFRQSEIAKDLYQINRVEYVMRLHRAIWDHYQERLFELYDLRQPNLWEEYSKFIREYYRIRAIRPLPGDNSPPFDKIC
jgi:hypothetical protein